MHTAREGRRAPHRAPCEVFRPTLATRLLARRCARAELTESADSESEPPVEPDEFRLRRIALKNVYFVSRSLRNFEIQLPGRTGLIR